MRVGLILLLTVAPLLARADGRGQAMFVRHCARCHVVGQGAPVPEKLKSLVDITLAARDHDRKWLVEFLQKPYTVNKDSECRAALDADGARRLYRFLRQRLRPPKPHDDGKTAGTTSPNSTGKIPPALPMHVVPAPVPPKPEGLVRR
jgi:hypothetical protein